MIERIKNAVAEGFRAAASTIHYLYLARIPFLGCVTLLALPLLAIGAGRPLVLAGYDLASRGEAFFVGIAYGLAGGSIYFTARVITKLCSIRFRLEINSTVQGRIDKAWWIAILFALLINILVAVSASKPVLSYSGQIVGAMVAGMLIAFAGASAAGAISASLPKNPVYRNLVWFGIKIGLRKQKGYLRRVSGDVETNDPQTGITKTARFVRSPTPLLSSSHTASSLDDRLRRWWRRCCCFPCASLFWPVLHSFGTATDCRY